jgi:hypothetical protein
MRLRELGVLVLCVAASAPWNPVGARQGAGAAVAPPAGSATARSVAAAERFLGLLGDAERQRASFPFDSAQKTNWSNLPSGIFERHSLRLGSLTPPQREAAMALMATVLSREGYQKVTDIMEADEVLLNRGGGRTGGRPGGGGRGGRGVVFGRDEYFIGILGRPSATERWLVQFGGHHLAINVTIAGSASVMTPSLPATQPATYTLNGRSIRPLGDEYDKSFAFMGTLNASQRSQAVLNYRVADLVLGAGQDGKTIAPEGILATSLTSAQQDMLLDLAREWVGILNDEGTAAKMAELRANLARTYFAWSGPTDPGSLAYFRIQGPTVVIEYAPQQNDADHIHTIYRDPTNDYGAKLVAR